MITGQNYDVTTCVQVHGESVWFRADTPNGKHQHAIEMTPEAAIKIAHELIEAGENILKK